MSWKNLLKLNNMSLEILNNPFLGNFKDWENGNNLQSKFNTQSLTDTITYQEDEYINLTELLGDIRYSNITKEYILKYDFKKYQKNIPQTYIMYGENHINVSAKIGLKNGKINVETQKLSLDKPYMSVFFNDKNRLCYTITFRYYNTLTTAVELETKSFNEYRLLLLYLGYGDINKDIESLTFFKNEFNTLLDNNKDNPDRLIAIYGDMTDDIMIRISLSTSIVCNHIIALTTLDDSGFLSSIKDTSGILIKALSMFRNYQQIADYFWKNPQLITRIYDNLDGTSDFLGFQVSNRILFASFLTQIAKMDSNSEKKTLSNNLRIDNGYYVDVSIFETNDVINDSINFLKLNWDFSYKKFITLQQKRRYKETIEVLDVNDAGDSTGETKQVEVLKDVEIGRSFTAHPMQLVHFVQSGEQKADLVTSLYVKAIADEKEWEEFWRAIRFGGDLLAIIFGILSLGSTASVSMIAIADIGLAATDILMMSDDVKAWLSNIPEGKWLADNWDVIYGLIGAGMLTVFMIRGILENGPKLLNAIKNTRKNLKTNPKIFVEQLEKLMIKLKSYETKLPLATKEIEGVIITEKANYLKKILKLVFSSADDFIDTVAKDLSAKGLSVNKTEEELYQIFYKGVLIKSGKNYEIGALLKTIHFRSGNSFLRLVMPVVNKTIKSSFTHLATSGAKLTGLEDIGTYLVGSFWSDFENILKQLDYPEITDIQILRDKNFEFPLPKGQKFNLLHASNEVVEYFSKKGGFFNRVNAKWVDAAVRQEAEVVIMSEFSSLRAPEFENGVQIGEKLTGFGKEVHRFEWKHGYRFNPKTKRMIPPNEAKGLKTLTKFEEYKIVD